MVVIKVGDIYKHKGGESHYICIREDDNNYYCFGIGHTHREMWTKKNDPTIVLVKRANRNAYPEWF